jgi:2TM domain
MEITDNGKDKLMWRIAKSRAQFKASLAAYLIVNTGLWGMWYFGSGPGSYIWPVWPTLGWGFGIAMHYYYAYHGMSADNIQREYDKLKKEL